jgi:hypothetical protein
MHVIDVETEDIGLSHPNLYLVATTALEIAQDTLILMESMCAFVGHVPRTLNNVVSAILKRRLTLFRQRLILKSRLMDAFVMSHDLS